MDPENVAVFVSRLLTARWSLYVTTAAVLLIPVPMPCPPWKVPGCRAQVEPMRMAEMLSFPEHHPKPSLLTQQLPPALRPCTALLTVLCLSRIERGPRASGSNA